MPGLYARPADRIERRRGGASAAEAAAARGLRYSTRTTAARLCVVSSPAYGPSNVPEVGGTSP